MSQIPGQVCYDVNSGRPPQDAAVSNFKSYGTAVAPNATFCLLQAAATVTDEAIVNNAAINNLTVGSLTVTGLSSGEPSYVYLPGLLAEFSGTTPPTWSASTNVFTFSAANGVATWTVNVPASTTRYVKFTLTTGTVTVHANGVLIGTTYGPGAITVSTDQFEWGGGSLTIAITASGGAASITGTPLVA